MRSSYLRLRLLVLCCCRRRCGYLNSELLEIFVISFAGLDGRGDLLSALGAVFLGPFLEELFFGFGGFLLGVISGAIFWNRMGVEACVWKERGY